MADTEWYYAENGERRGPVDAAELRRMADLGVVQPSTLVWRAGMSDWEPAHRHLPGLVPPLPPAPDGRAERPAVVRGGEAPQIGGGRDYFERVGLGEAFGRFFRNYATFSGRSNRGEFWWAWLALILAGIVISFLDAAVFGFGFDGFGPLSGLWSLATLIPSLALGARRLHDTDRSGWWQLLAFIPLVGIIILIVWWAQAPDPRPNRFG